MFAWCLSEFVGIEYRQPNDLGHPDEVIKSTPGTTLFMKIKGISPLKGIKKWALEGALNGGALSTALQAHVYGQTRAILLTVGCM